MLLRERLFEDEFYVQETACGTSMLAQPARAFIDTCRCISMVALHSILVLTHFGGVHDVLNTRHYDRRDIAIFLMVASFPSARVFTTSSTTIFSTSEMAGSP